MNAMFGAHESPWGQRSVFYGAHLLTRPSLPNQNWGFTDWDYGGDEEDIWSWWLWLGCWGWCTTIRAITCLGRKGKGAGGRWSLKALSQEETSRQFMKITPRWGRVEMVLQEDGGRHQNADVHHLWLTPCPKFLEPQLFFFLWLHSLHPNYLCVVLHLWMLW